MKIVWLGHSGFRIETEGAVLLIDPWLEGNPMFPQERSDEATDGATHVLLTHGHGDHASNALGIALRRAIPIVCGHELAEGWAQPAGAQAIGFGKGGTVALNGAKVTMVNASHSSSIDFEGALRPCGAEAGFMIAGEGEVIYVSGDTDLMADMEWMADYHKPTIGILAAGGHYTMDMARAAYACRRWFRFHTVIPCHYRTFPALAQDARELVAGVMPGTRVIEPQVMQPVVV